MLHGSSKKEIEIMLKSTSCEIMFLKYIKSLNRMLSLFTLAACSV